MKKQSLISLNGHKDWQPDQTVWFGGYRKNRQATIVCGFDSDHCIVKDDKGRVVKKAFATLFVKKEDFAG